MGIDARLIVYSKSQDQAETACIAAFAKIAALEAIMSDYRKDSELMKLCDRAGGPPVRVSKPLFDVLTQAKKVSELSGGAFDVTVGPVIQLWRAARREKAMPDPGALKVARELVGHQKVRLNSRNRTVQLTAQGMKLDLGGIAKGYAADAALAVLTEHGITSALVELGGDIAVSDAPPGTDGWTIAAPVVADSPELKLKNAAISTSGDTEQFAIINGRRYSHVVDPRTGYALTNRVQVTVIAPRAGLTDPLATAISVLGSSRYEALTQAFPHVKAYVKVLPFGG